MISFLLAIQACLDPAAIEKIRLAAKNTPKYTLSFNSARALSRLKKKVKAEDLSSLVHAALDVTLSLRLTTKQIESLVEWMVSGKPASEFDPNSKTDVKPRRRGAKKDKTEKGKGEDQSGKTKTLDHDKLIQLAEQAKAEKALGKETTAQKKLEKYLRNLFSSSSSSKKSQNASGSKKGFSETIMLDWLLDINIIKQIKSKAKKGQSVTKGEVALLWLHKAGELVGHLVKGFLWLFKPFFKAIHWVWKILIDTLEEVGLLKYAKALAVFGGFFIALWFACEIFNYGFMRPVEMIWSKIHFHHAAEESPSANGSNNVPSPFGDNLAQPTPSPQLVVSAKAPSASRSKPSPVIAYIPSISFKTSDYDPKLLEQEIAAIPANSVIKDYVFQPVEGMPADLAVSQLQDLTDADKYTMMIGSGKQKILSFTPSNTNFIIAYKSTDLFGVFGDGSGKMTFFWEDVLYIHINEIDHFSQPGAQPDIKYQITWVVKGAKNPLTIQCDSKDDLENLVSAMEYFIRHSRLAHDAQPAGMPYPTQGVRLSGDCVVEKIWAGSPAWNAVSNMDTAQLNSVAPRSGVNQLGASQQVKAGLGLGDHLWSIGKVTPEQQSRKDLEAGLSPNLGGLSSLPVTVFAASPSEWDKAQVAARQPGGSNNSIHPKLRKVALNAP